MKERAQTSRRNERAWQLFGSVRRSFAEFLLLPTAVMGAFLGLAGVTFALDRAELRALAVVRETMSRLVFGSTEATSSLLSSLATGLITLTSITFSVLLLAVQQAAATLTSEVIDQFLRRRLNQLFFGFFLGLALFALVVLSTVQADFNPVIGATVALLLSMLTLYGLVVMIYVTVNQIRPVNIIQAIHDRTLLARTHQWRGLTSRTRRFPRSTGSAPVSVTATENGFLVGVDIDTLALAARADGRDDGEVVLRPSLGHYVSYGDVVADVWPAAGWSAEDAEDVVRRGLTVGNTRDLDRDPGYGVQQLVDVGWTTISTAKHSPAPGLQAIAALRDLLARWANEDESRGDGDPPLPVVYRDETPSELLNGLELLAVVSTESMQVQAFVEVLTAVEVLFERLPPGQQARSEDLVLRSLSAMGDHVLTAPLDRVLSALGDTLRTAGRTQTAASVDRARSALSGSVGQLHARGDRVPTAGTA